MSSSPPYLGEVSAGRCVLLVCDVQERFAPSVLHFDAVTENVARMARAARIAAVPVLATEQYPKGLGPTVPTIREHLSDSDIVAKTKFTMIVPEVEERLHALRKDGRDTVLLCGLETHVCVVATCQDLRRMGMNVQVICDACTSRTQVDRHLALTRMRQIGAFLNTAESAILALAGDAKHENFKQLQAVIKTINEDTGLLLPKSTL